MSRKTSSFPPTQNTMKLLYMEHLKRLAVAKTKIDTTGGKINVKALANMNQLETDFLVFRRTHEDNIKLLQKINRIGRLNGKIDSYAKVNVFKNRYLDIMAKRIQAVEKENFALGNRICCAKAKVESIRPLTKEQKRAIAKRKEHFEIPTKFLKKYEGYEFKIPKLVSDQRKLFRPEFYMDLEVKGFRKLDRIVIQLFTEAAPQVVLEFMHIFARRNRRRIVINRLFPNLWLEGEILVDRGSSLVKKPLEFDKRIMGHEADCGILSFPKRYLNGFSYGFLSFNISFRPLSCLNGERVAFGRIIRGKRTFQSISTFGNQNGRPYGQIIIHDSGLVY